MAAISAYSTACSFVARLKVYRTYIVSRPADSLSSLSNGMPFEMHSHKLLLSRSFYSRSVCIIDICRYFPLCLSDCRKQLQTCILRWHSSSITRRTLYRAGNFHVNHFSEICRIKCNDVQLGSKEIRQNSTIMLLKFNYYS